VRAWLRAAVTAAHNRIVCASRVTAVRGFSKTACVGGRSQTLHHCWNECSGKRKQQHQSRSQSLHVFRIWNPK